jgi:hypothetical protein
MTMCWDCRCKDVLALFDRAGRSRLRVQLRHQNPGTKAPGQPQQIYEALQVPKRLVRFTAEDVAETHCQSGALA